MSYPDSEPLFMPQQSPYRSGSDAIAIRVWPQFPTNSNEQFDPHSFEQPQPSYKRPRNSEDDNNINQSMNSRMPPSNNIPVNKGTTNIFFKTRMCAKFRNGSCRNGENCNFAHGMQDLRHPPPNWQELVGVGGARSEDENKPTGNWEDDQRIIHKMKLCKKFYNGEECPYGDRCNFLHEEPSKFRDDGGRYRESSAISIGTTVSSTGQISGEFDVIEANKNWNNSGSDASRVTIVKPVYWKTKLCTKWKITGQCPFGDKCHFAHGQAELQSPGGRLEGEAATNGSILANASTFLVDNGSPSKIPYAPRLGEERQSKKCLLKWKEPKKINRIYADWLDDHPLGQNLTNHARALLEWHNISRFCGHCGVKTVPLEAGRRLQCSNESCKKRIYPRVDPVVIMLVIDNENDRVLLGRQSRFVPRLWSCLAGFIEPGESLEEAVRRETWEEAGFEVGEVVYHSSQPWPVGPSGIPCQLMVGFFAYAKSVEINVDKEELQDAQWHNREDVKRAFALAEYKKAQLTAADKVDQMCRGVERGQSLSTDFNLESGELAPMFFPGPFAISHHLISSWVNNRSTIGEAQQPSTSLSNL